MPDAPDTFERSRAAVAVSCLRWLQCTGPGPVAPRPSRGPKPDAPPTVGIGPIPPVDAPHPLWDRWLDG